MTMLDPAERSARGAALQAKIYGHEPAPPETPWQESVRDFVYAEVWSRPGLDLRSRFAIALAGAALCDFPDATLDGVVRGALQTESLSLRELREAALHLAVYGGWGRGGLLDSAITRVANELGLPPAECPPIRGEAWDPAVRTAEGEAEFKAVMTFPGGPPASPYLEAISNFVFGEMWCRYDGLDQRTRRWITLVGVCESAADTPIRSHVHAAMASGNCKPEEMQEFVLQYGLAAGWPKASVVQGVVFEMSKKVAEGLTWDGKPAK
jgi:4-carboxymuconolactone decarboxylase